ncbi:MAG: hypothetical protein HY703_04320 [Gemmatimonadetes bacterium]|nr:hypothetical protein [Gemmatimonadota bacterium]
MHTEHLQNVRLGWVAAGWLVSAAAASLIALAFAGLGLLRGDGGTDSLWLLAAVTLGFGVGGFFTGFRAIEAPILHGVAIGLASLVAWFLLNLAVSGVFRVLEWQRLSPTLTAGLLLLQMGAAVAGAEVGHRIAQHGGKLDLRETEGE